MTKSRKLLALFLAIAALLSCFVTGCDSTPVETTPETDPVTEPVETEAPARTAFDLISDGTPKVSVVRPDASGTNDADVQAAMSIRSSLMAYSKDTVTISTDWTKDGKHDANAVEILVGMTNYDETLSVASDLRFGDYTIKVVGNKIVVLGHTDTAMAYAALILGNAIKAAAVQNDSTKNYTVSIPIAGIEKTGTKNSVISSLPAFDNGTFYATYDPGNDCDEVIIAKTTPEAYKAYVEKLKGEGYTLYTSREIQDNCFATLYNKSYTINIGYYKNNKQVRIIMEPYSAKTLIGLEADNKYEVVTTSQITMIGLEYQKSDGWAGNGLSVLIRLTDGRFIVVDGGFNREKDATMLISAIKEQSKEYSSKTGMTIAAWIITHAHGDHQGMIGKQYALFKNNKVKIERFLVNFMSDTERNKAINTYTSNWSSGEGGGWTQIDTAASYNGADVCVVHVGQIFYLADLQLESLYTIESYGPSVTNALNTTSLIFKCTFTDPITKKQTVYMSTGDATGPGFQITAAMYGDYLKSDIVQVAHHGYTTWGTENGTMTAYKKMAPTTLLWPQGSNAYPNYVNKSYNAVLWNLSDNPNYKETYVAGLEGTLTIFPIPYTVGAATVKAP